MYFLRSLLNHWHAVLVSVICAPELIWLIIRAAVTREVLYFVLPLPILIFLVCFWSLEDRATRWWHEAIGVAQRLE